MTEQNYAPVRDSTTLAESTLPKKFKLADISCHRQDISPEDLATEEWRPVTEYEDRFEISSLGRIRALKHHPTMGRPTLGIRKTRRGRDGYERLCTSIIINGTRLSVNLRIHRLVAAAFHPNPENLPCVHHKDNNKVNNRASNLEWVTVQQNVQYAIEQVPGRKETLKQLHLHSSVANPAKRKPLS